MLGGGFAGALRRAAARQAGRDDRLAAELDALHAAPPRGRVGHARAAARRRAAATDVPARRARARPRDVARHGARTVAVETIAGPARDRATSGSCIALGAVSRVFPVPGLAEHGRGFKDLADAIELRNHVLERLDAAAAGRPGVGARRSSSSAPATPGSRRSPSSTISSQAALRYYPTLARRPAALGARRRGADRSWPRSRGGSATTRRGGSSGAGSRSTSATTLASYDGETAVLSGGTRDAGAHARLDGRREGESRCSAQLGLPLDERGRVRVDSAPAVEGLDGVWALGDGAAVPNAGDAGPDRPADLPARAPAGAAPREEPHRRAAAVRLPDARPGGDARPLQGDRRRARASTSSAFPAGSSPARYHLYALPLLSRKLRVVADWTIALFFRRDIAELSRLGHPEGLERERHRAALRAPPAHAAARASARRRGRSCRARVRLVGLEEALPLLGAACRAELADLAAKLLAARPRATDASVSTGAKRSP